MEFKNLEIQKTLVLSTAHVTEKDNNFLSNNNIAFSSVYVNDYGYSIFINPHIEVLKLEIEELKNLGLSNNFCDLMQLAHDKKCEYLKLDCDGNIYQELPSFDW